MGVIKDGTISGVLPDTRGFLVHYPGYPSSVSRALDTLGGIQGILKARSSESNKLELHFRPEDPYSHPTFGELQPSNNFLLKISKRKPHDTHDAKDDNSMSRYRTENGIQENQPESDQMATNNKAEDCISANEEGNLCADIVSHFPKAYCFNGMADYQHVVPVHADVARRKKRNWAEVEEPAFDKGGLMDVDHEDVMIIAPPLFSPKDMPKDLVLKPPAILSSKLGQEEVVPNHVEIHSSKSYSMPCVQTDMEQVLALDFDIKEIPKIVNWEEYVPQGSDQRESQMAVSRLFDERPIWSKNALSERLLDIGLRFTHSMLRRLLSRISYYFSNGPFLRFWIKKGYDPRKDPDSRMLKPRWEDICTFRAFPYKLQTSLQLFELADDYIQSEINKPPSQASCTFATGWLSQHMLNCIRQRLTVRFLPVFPKPGTENLLRAATLRFEKLKRECSRNALKLKGEEAHKANLVETEENDEPENVEEDEEEAAGGNNSEEELDADEELDMDGDSEMLVPPHSYLNMENISRTHLQDLFGSFPFNEVDNNRAQEDDIDDEYQIYEEDSEGDYSDE
ncbi:general transcription factor 3C polypeptide 5-like isoform X3 [Arachis ipaensis]|uniref:general transcription factor 3C polypeptide 5-like isoform X3 n=1 Tax=Arachis ipaensis TaxID=130454 RepID=UPI000A2B5F1F|nr:general transcription factor 3C polypeptide 5-like isoform X3 [Arachis ipaensis]